MRKFFALVKKELKELINAQLIVSFGLMIVIFQVVGRISQTETRKLAQRQELGVALQDAGIYGTKVKEALSSAFIVFEVEGNQETQWIENASQQDLRHIVVVPSDFSEKISNGERAKIRIYSIAKTLGLRERIQKTILSSIVQRVSDAISSELIKLKTANVDPNFIKNPVEPDEFVYIRGKVINVQSEIIYGYIMVQSMFIPIILFLLLVLTSQMIATAMGQEKENKTLETLLTTPVSRLSIIFAKMLSSALLAVLFAGAYMYGFRGYMTTGTGGAIEQAGAIAKEVGLILPPQGVFLFGITIFLALITGLLMTTIISLFIQDVRSAQLAITPVMILVLIPYMLSFVVDISELSLSSKILLYAIPFVHPFYFYRFYMLGHTTEIALGLVYLIFVNIVLTIVILKLFSTDILITSRIGWKKRKGF
jgi:ABC-2 type transport system permease protein